VSELRMRGIDTVEAAQAFLPEFMADFNRRFGRAPARAQAVWRRPPRDLALRLACHYRRIVARDNTVRLGARWVQVRGSRSYAALPSSCANSSMAGSSSSTTASSAARPRRPRRRSSSNRAAHRKPIAGPAARAAPQRRR
jgi:hypothetical protein